MNCVGIYNVDGLRSTISVRCYLVAALSFGVNELFLDMEDQKGISNQGKLIVLTFMKETRNFPLISQRVLLYGFIKRSSGND
jgi:hypothetical protein